MEAAQTGGVRDRQQLETLFLENLALIERIARLLSRRHALPEADAEEFTSWLKAKIVEDGYAIFKKFRGDSALSTYLTVVVAMLFRDFRVQLWGRWRPSAAATRVGHVGVRLETLVRRDHLSLQQAAELLRTSGETSLSDRELAALLNELPERGPLRPIVGAIDSAADVASEAGADHLVSEGEMASERGRAHSILREALAAASEEDQVILRMHFWDGLTVAQISRALHLDQKPLYRRLQRLLDALRQRLEQQGLSRENVRALVEREVK